MSDEPRVFASPGFGGLAVAHTLSAPFPGLTVRVEAMDPFSPALDAVPTAEPMVLRNPAHWVTALALRGLVTSASDGRRALETWCAIADAWLERDADAAHPASAVDYGDVRLEPSRLLYAVWRAWGLDADPRALDIAIRSRERRYIGAGGCRVRFGNPDRPRSERKLRGASWRAVRALMDDARYAGLFERFEWPTSPKRYRVPKRER